VPADPDPISDLMLRARAGDQEAARRIVNHFTDALSRAVGLHLRQEVRPTYGDSDIVQLVFLDLFTGEVPSDVLSSSERLMRYLFAVARNKVRQLHRQELGTQKRCRDRVVPLDDSIPDRYPGPDMVAAAEDEWCDLQRRLPPLWRRLFALLREGHSRGEVARRTGLSHSALDRIVQGSRLILAAHRSHQA
jgi:DNA-directed RNA polymerase specialized sigma24 family protein